MKKRMLLAGIGLLTAVSTSLTQAQKALKPDMTVAKAAQNISKSEMTQLVNASLLGSQPTKLPGKKGTYGVLFLDYNAYALYKERILDHLDDFIEAASVDLSPKSNDITELLLAKIFSDVSKKEQAAGIPPTNYYQNYVRFVNSFRQQLKDIDYVGLMQNDPVKFLSSVLNQAGTDQCISYCTQPFEDYTLQFTNSPYTASGGQAAIYVSILLGYNNVAKQNNPVYKALYDAYVARQTNASLANYQPLSNYHGSKMPFTLYQLPFGTLASKFVDGDKLKSYTLLLWDKTCGCPSAAGFLNATEAQKAAFTIP